MYSHIQWHKKYTVYSYVMNSYTVAVSAVLDAVVVVVVT